MQNRALATKFENSHKNSQNEGQTIPTYAKLCNEKAENSLTQDIAEVA